jgi:surface-anchored protein
MNLKSLLLTLGGAATALAATPPTDLIYGHYEPHLEYTASEGWRVSISYDMDNDFSSAAGVVRLDPATTRLVAAPSTLTVVPSSPGVFSRFGPAGTPLWILPQANVLGRLFLGVRAVVAPGIFQASINGNYVPSASGSIALELVSVTGTGPDAGGKFATWKTEGFGTPVFSFDTTDGITAADRIGTIPVASHTHYNWAFTKPGTYAVTLLAKGKLMPAYGNTLTGAYATFNFVIPFSSRIGSGGGLRVVEEAGMPRLILADPANGVAYAADRAIVEASSPATPATAAAVPGAQWEMACDLSPVAAALPNGVGISPLLSATGPAAENWSALALELVDVIGPAGFALLNAGAVAADGPGDLLPINPGVVRPLTAAFGATGIYRVTVILRGTRLGQAVASAPVTVCFGAGVTADFGYAQWANSFEQGVGWAPGSLANVQADPDHDGLSNSVEFALFWHGLDPTVADADRMPLPGLTPDGSGMLPFLRDTFKDPLDETRWQILPGASTDLVNWEFRSSRVPGFPLELSESGAEEGNACGRILHRALRLPPGSAPNAFFRFKTITNNAF